MEYLSTKLGSSMRGQANLFFCSASNLHRKLEAKQWNLVFKQLSKWSFCPKFYSLHHIPSTKFVFGYKHISFTILIWRLLLHCLTFLFVVFIDVVFCPISYSTHSMLGLYFFNSPSSSTKSFKFYLNVWFFFWWFKSIWVPWLLLLSRL